ncbi:MAG: ABC transporter permease [Deltaproteobacteria bacterium]|nr:ABC transporter permease [Deltaproteobacteria bacterium]
MNNMIMETYVNNGSMSMSLGKTLRAYLIEAKYAFISILRIPVLPITMMALPVFMYMLLAVTVVSRLAAENPNVAVSFFSGFLIFAVIGPGLFGFGVGLAIERQGGILNLKRAQPMPPASILIAKMITAMACTGFTILLLIPTAMKFGHLHLASGQIVNVVLVSIFGVLPFCSIGFLIGTMVSGTGAIGIVNLIFLPMLYLSGMFFPLPEILQPWARVWPTFYMNQIVWSAVGIESQIDVKICILILLGITVLCTGLAARRFARVG